MLVLGHLTEGTHRLDEPVSKITLNFWLGVPLQWEASEHTWETAGSQHPTIRQLAVRQPAVSSQQSSSQQ